MVRALALVSPDLSNFALSWKLPATKKPLLATRISFHFFFLWADGPARPSIFLFSANAGPHHTTSVD